ncbi:hypothetical protein TNCV_3384141 [Trichonephila clavipes]|uniref:Uncharacterized protein n=1 Tax=Trichonephila clavipes TaxID=2585209 RepID=A0A8X6SQW4_TRICX|nr:hypothetical protein TNCV_3384141 [Trichonephila clavipes]
MVDVQLASPAFSPETVGRYWLCEGEHCREQKTISLVERIGVVRAYTFLEKDQTSNGPCSIHRPAIMRAVNRRSFVIILFTFSMFSSLTEVVGLSLRELSETLSCTLKRVNPSYTHFMDSSLSS